MRLITHSTFEDLSNFLDLKIPENAFPSITGTWLPSVVMTLFFSRFIIFFVINMIMVIAMIVRTVRTARDDQEIPNQRTVPLKPPKPAIKTPRVPYLEESNRSRVENWNEHYGENPNVYNTSNDYIRPSEPSRDTQMWAQVSSRNNTNYIDPHANSHPTAFGNNTNVMVNGVPSGTLRRQLPWTYISNTGFRSRLQKATAPPAPPPLPPPDYSVRLPRTFSLNLEEKRWTQYS